MSALDVQNNDGLATTAARSRWLRIAKILGLSIVVGPLIAAAMMFVEAITIELMSARYAVTLDTLPHKMLAVIAMAYLVGAPYALVTSTLFAVAAVLFGWRQLVVSLAAALVPILPMHLVPALGDPPIWQWPMFFVLNTIVLIIVPTTVCWLLTRRWHSPSA